jgi:hypothetical protein
MIGTCHLAWTSSAWRLCASFSHHQTGSNLRRRWSLAVRKAKGKSSSSPFLLVLWDLGHERFFQKELISTRPFDVSTGATYSLSSLPPSLVVTVPAGKKKTKQIIVFHKTLSTHAGVALRWELLLFQFFNIRSGDVCVCVTFVRP